LFYSSAFIIFPSLTHHVRLSIYVDIIDYIDCVIDTNGLLASCSVHGDILCNSKLSGRAPEVLLSFSNIGIIDDMSLHPCVKYNRCTRICCLWRLLLSLAAPLLLLFVPHAAFAADSSATACSGKCMRLIDDDSRSAHACVSRAVLAQHVTLRTSHGARRTSHVTLSQFRPPRRQIQNRGFRCLA
jgi:hypothetical protein